MSNYTQLGFVKQTDGENIGTWGDVLNDSLIDLLDDAIGGYVEVSVASGDVTLAFADGTADDNGRHAVIKFTGSPGTTRTITFPNKQKTYYINNGSDGSVICTAGTGAATVTIPTSKKTIIYVDGSDEIHSMYSSPALADSSITNDMLAGSIAMSKTAFSAGTGVTLSTNTLNVDAAQTGITSITNTSLVVGRDADNDIDFATDNNIIFRAAGADQIVLKDGVLEPVTDDDVALGTTGSKRFTNLFLSGKIDADGNADIGGNLNLNGSFEIDVASGDPKIIFDTQGADKFHIAVDDSDSDNFVIKSGGTVGSGNGLKLDSSGNLIVDGDLTVSGDDITLGTNTDTAIMVADGTNFNPVVPSGDVGLTNAGVFSISSGVIVNDDVNASAAIAYSKLNLSDSIVNADINASAAIADSKLATISTANKVSVDAVDIDGATDIGADLTTSDLIVVDDGAGGTNRKAALSRLTTYMTGQGFSTEDPTALAIALG